MCPISIFTFPIIAQVQDERVAAYLHIQKRFLFRFHLHLHLWIFPPFACNDSIRYIYIWRPVMMISIIVSCALIYE